MIFVTGSQGFIGHWLCLELTARGHAVVGAARSLDMLSQEADVGLRYAKIDNISSNTDWSGALSGVDCIIHCAARAHVMNEAVEDAITAYRSVNVSGTKRLAEQAAEMGVQRLVYLSSIKVNGEQTSFNQPFTISDGVAPEDPYGVSKYEAEQVLQEISVRTGLEIVTVRPPLVYGPGVKGNLARLLGLVRRGLPLPLGAVDNRRSLIGLDNLVDLLIRCIDHPSAVGQTFLVSDGEDLSTPDLLHRMAAAMGQSARLIPVPELLLRLAGRLVGRSNEVNRLIGSLQVDSSHTCEVLDWAPPVSVDEGILRMVQC